MTIIAIICAFVVKGMCGFANTLVFSTMISFWTPNINITPIDLIVGYPSNIYIAYKERKSVSAKVWIPLSALVICGSLPGVFFLKNGDTALIKTVFGFVVVFIGIEMLLREHLKVHPKNSKIVLSVIGIASGILCGLFGIGAFLVAYISRTTNNQNEFRGNLCIVFLVENTFRMILYFLTGILNPILFKQAILLMPFMIMGLTIGMFLTNKVSEKKVKKAVIILLVLSGVSLIIKNIGM